MALGGPDALRAHSRGFRRVEIAIADEQIAQQVHQVIPWATNASPKQTHQAQLAEGIQQLQESIRRSQGRGKRRQQPRQKPVQKNSRQQKQKQKDKGMDL